MTWRGWLVQAVGLVGFVMLGEGVRRVHVPASLVLCGALLMAWAVLKSRRA